MTSSPRYPSNSVNWHKYLLWIIPVSILWIYLWFFSWQGIFRSFHWAPIGMSIFLFTIPGICVYGLLVKSPLFSISHITFGFVISHLIFASLGTLGRLIQLSFETIKILMAIVGLIFFLKYLLVFFRSGIKKSDWLINKDNLLSLLLLILVTITACLVVIQRIPSDDDLSYLSYIMNWQHSISLDFNDIIFGETKLVHPRFWLMSVPFAQALLADISRVPGILLLSGYYEPFLVILAVLCWYELARTFGFSPQSASTSCILQLVFLLFLSDYLHPGAPFYNQLSADKATAAFIITPVFFQSLFLLIERTTKNYLSLFLLIGWSLTLTHPIILAYAAFVAGAILLINWAKFHLRQKKFILLIFLLVLLPHITLRFVNLPAQAESPYTTQDVFGQRGIENLIQRWGNTQFYGFNSGILDMKIPYDEKYSFFQSAITRGWLIFPLLSAAFALKRSFKKTAEQFILACFSLGMLAWIPFTGWIIGYFLSAYMLERAIWLFPFGLSVIYTFLILRDNIQNKLRPQILPSWNPFVLPNWHLLAITTVALGLFSLYFHENNLPNIEKFLEKSQRYQGLSIAGKELDRHISDHAYVIGSPNLNDLIPSISWKSQLITFRISDPSNMSYYAQEERNERISDSKELFTRSASADEKMNLLEKYDVHFLFITPFDLQFFEELIETYPNRISTIEEGGVIIIKIN